MKIFEATLKGFDGSTDNTDHLVKWVSASSLESAEKAVKDAGYELDRPLEEITDPLIFANEGIDLFTT